MAMEVERLEDISVVYWLKDLFSATPYVNIADGYPEQPLELPMVISDSNFLVPVELELGNSKRYNNRSYYIDIYANSKTQRDEIGYKIIHALEDGIPVYDYNQGFPPAVTPTRLGCLEMGTMRMDVIKILPDLVSKMYYRATISFVATNNRI